MNTLKATCPEDSSDSIVISFDGKWLDPLRRSELSLVFRKRGPKNIVPRFIYVYIGSPHCLLLGRLAVTRYELLSTRSALQHTAKAGLTADELAQYLKGYDTVAAFTVGHIHKTATTTSLQRLAATFGFTPPQSFFVLSHNGRRLLDEFAGISEPHGGRRNDK
jgi:predicted transcriptional regulator